MNSQTKKWSIIAHTWRELKICSKISVWKMRLVSISSTTILKRLKQFLNYISSMEMSKIYLKIYISFMASRTIEGKLHVLLSTFQESISTHLNIMMEVNKLPALMKLWLKYMKSSHNFSKVKTFQWLIKSLATTECQPDMEQKWWRMEGCQTNNNIWNFGWNTINLIDHHQSKMTLNKFKRHIPTSTITSISALFHIFSRKS